MEPNENEVAQNEGLLYGDDLIVGVFRKIRDARTQLAKEYKQADEVLETQLNVARNELLKRLNDRGSTQTQTPSGTAFVVVEMQANIGDELEWKKFVMGEEDPLGFYTKRLKKERLVTWMKDHGGRVPPGVNVFHERVINVRAPRKTGAPTGPESFEGPEDFSTKE